MGNDGGIGLTERAPLKVPQVDIVSDGLSNGYGCRITRLAEIDADDEARRIAHKMPRACSA
jgi:hypothetical protein